ncbi:MAG: hypothetical protein A3G75_10105 [Verrucomicrobia bacterium RIFCSPLOWO2_12_FULL_64_8]|nr:MAG: hypothetical protein A3G75_10105 [Verrucomicrobia bacterium RIFCSPLOWO2_12_FULL_64_8]
MSRIGAIKSGQLRSSLRHLFYGPEGVGKSSLAADAPKPLFVDVEGGADNIDVARYMFRDEEGGHVPRLYAEVTAAIEDLIANPSHGYETLVLDTIDALEALVHRHVCETNGKSSIEEFGFGKGYQVALDEFRRFLALLDGLRAKGMQVVMLGHSIVKTFKNPEGEDYDRYQLRVHDKTGGLIKEWCDIVGFVRFDGGAAKLKGDASQAKRARGWATGKRVVHLARDAAWDAKSRLSMPAEIELGVAHPWEPFASASSGARDSSVDDVKAAIVAELDRIGVESFTTAAGKATTRTELLSLVERADATIRTRILSGLKATNPAQES